MNPFLAALFVGASFATSIFSNRQQQRADNVNIDLQVSQARLQASEAALERTKSYRQNVSQSLALSGMGFGSTTALATATAESYGNYLADINALNTQSAFAVASGQASKAGAKSKRFANDIYAVDSAVTLADKLGLFK